MLQQSTYQPEGIEKSKFDAIFNPYLEHIANSDHGKPGTAINPYAEEPKIELADGDSDTDMDHTTNANVLEEAKRAMLLRTIDLKSDEESEFKWMLRASHDDFEA